MKKQYFSHLKIKCVFSELDDKTPSNEMVTASSLVQSDGIVYLHIEQLFENISAFDIDGEGEVSLNQFK